MSQKGSAKVMDLHVLLFNTALEKVITDSKIQTTRIIFYKSTQVLAYADEVIIIGRTLTAMTESFLSLERERWA
jgi:sorting nexin-29